MNEYVSVHVTSAEQLLQFETIRLRSWKGDYLHRPDGPSGSGVTTWPTGALDWWAERAASGRVRLRSWKGDYLHRPDGPPGVTTWPAGELEWTVEATDGAIRLRSWKGDCLCRPDPPGWLTTANSGGIDWSIEGKWSDARRSAWESWLAMMLKDKNLRAGGIYGQQDGACRAASPTLEITPSEARALAAGLRDPTPLQAAGALIAGQKFMFLTVLETPARPGGPVSSYPTLVLRRGPVTALAVNTLTTTLVGLTVEGILPANVTGHLTTAYELLKRAS